MVLSRLRNDQHGERGAVAIIVAVFAVVMFGLASLVVDLGVARDTRREAQNAADASALAAIGACMPMARRPTSPRRWGWRGATPATNFGTGAADWATCSATSHLAYAPVTPCISFDSATAPTRVRVVIPSGGRPRRSAGSSATTEWPSVPSPTPSSTAPRSRSAPSASLVAARTTSRTATWWSRTAASGSTAASASAATGRCRPARRTSRGRPTRPTRSPAPWWSTAPRWRTPWPRWRCRRHPGCRFVPTRARRDRAATAPSASPAVAPAR